MTKHRMEMTPACMTALDLSFNFGHLLWIQPLEKFPGPVLVEIRIFGFDAQKKPILCRVPKPFDLE